MRAHLGTRGAGDPNARRRPVSRGGTGAGGQPGRGLSGLMAEVVLHGMITPGTLAGDANDLADGCGLVQHCKHEVGDISAWDRPGAV